MRHIRKFVLIIFLTLQSYSAIAEPKLSCVFALDLVRHGDRSPLHVIPLAPTKWEQGAGQLTPLGMQQMYDLGAALRQKYVLEENLLPSTYQASTIYVRSTDYDRTLMSAQSLLLGLYPNGPLLPIHYQPIPIHTENAQHDNTLIDTKEPKVAALIKQNFTEPQWQQKKKLLQSKFRYWSKMTGMNIQDLTDLSQLGDTLLIYQTHHLPMPVGLSQADMQDIIEAGSWALAAKFKNQKVSQALAENLLHRIVEYLEQAIAKQSARKWVLFVGHDSSILALMSALGAPLSYSPPYAADLNFTVWERNPGEYQIKISLNNKPVEIPACGKEFCTLEQLQRLNQPTQDLRAQTFHPAQHKT